MQGWVGARGVAVALVALAVLLSVQHAVAYGTAYDVGYLVVMLGAGAVAWWGTRGRTGLGRTLGLLVTGAIVSTALADVVWYGYYWTAGEPDVSAADALYLFSYVLLGAALVLTLLRTDRGHQRLEGAVDAATIVVVCLLVLWELAVQGILNDTSVGWGTRLVWAAYPVLDATLLGLILRVLWVREARSVVGPALGVLSTQVGYEVGW